MNDPVDSRRAECSTNGLVYVVKVELYLKVNHKSTLILMSLTYCYT